MDALCAMEGAALPESIIIKPAIARAYEDFRRSERVLFFSAPCGFGKTAVAEALCRGEKVLSLSAAAPDFALPETADGWSTLLIDDLQQQDDAFWRTLCDYIRPRAGKKFILLSRGTPPGELMAFQYTGLMTVLDADALLFDCRDIRAYFDAHGVAATDTEIAAIQKRSSGYPLAVVIAARCMAPDKPFTPEITARVYDEIFRYFEPAVLQRFSLSVRRFLLDLAPFQSFDLDMAKVITGNVRAGELLDWLQRNTTMLLYDGVRRFRLWPQFRAFLLWEMERTYSPEKRRALFGRSGLYFELKQDYAHALECYIESGDSAKMSELLIRNAERHPGMGHYSKMEKYYRVLPEKEILASPSLMQGMSMLCALATDYAGSERWYGELEQFARRCTAQDAAGREARSRLAWLDISLPQRSTASLTETFPAVFRLVTNQKITLPPFSVTSTLPSIMNGGKDFSAWSKNDALLYRTLRLPVETVLGRDGVGLADAAIAESRFEKGEDITSRMLSLVQRMGEIQRDGTPDIEFAVTGLLCRSLMAAGEPEDARRAVEQIRARFISQGETRFLPNIDALLCRIALRTGNLDYVDAWYREKAPRDALHLNVMKRYQYFTQAMAELSAGKPDAALLTLAPLESYCKTCARYIDSIHLSVLRAIALYRKKDSAWKDSLAAALAEAESFGFIRTVSVYGAAVLPLLEALGETGSARWYKKLLSDVRIQAAYYPRFLQPRLAPGEELTAAERQVLSLLCADKSNAEIGEIMDIKLTTVKTHVSHILDKLGVSRRSEAKTAAQKLRLVPEDRS